MKDSRNQPGDSDSAALAGKKIAIAVSTYHSDITDRLLAGARETLDRAGVDESGVWIVAVPGAWELAVAATRLIDQVDAVICLGVVIRGETTHDQYINSMLAAELGRISVDSKKPVAFGVLTCNSVDQAKARSGGAVGNKGEEAAAAAVDMLRLFEEEPFA